MLGAKAAVPTALIFCCDSIFLFSIAPLLIEEVSVETRRLNYTECEVGWTLEDNDLVNSLIVDMKGRRAGVYRIYEKRIGA